MSILLGCEGLHLEFPTKKVFDEVTLSVNTGDRIGIVGRNGDGKSTLIALLSHQIEPQAGQVVWRNGVSVGVLGQADTLDDAETVAGVVVGETPEYEWASSARIRDIIDGLLRDIPWDGRIGDLSGGQRRRVDLARLLVDEWDVLMLDEPTNHLDMRAITWLADHLNARWPAKAGALLVVTHDRWFLDEVCLGMWEVHDERVEPFEGGYSAYVLQRVERDRQTQAIEQKRGNLMRRELAWLSRGARARSSKPRFHVEAAQALIADVPPLRDSLELKRLACSRLGKQVVDLKDVMCRFEEGKRTKTVLDGVTWSIGAGDRLGILGENGQGKTTLLRIMSGMLAPTSGRAHIGATVHAAMLSQRLEELAEQDSYRIREVLSRYKTTFVVDGKEITSGQMLQRLGFSEDQLNSRIGDLSGGQRRRLQLLLTLLGEPNVLILDEPGNDMDTDMLAVLEDLLDAWPGTLIVVSHDRYLMERVTDDQYALLDGHLRHVPGGVDEYLRLLDARRAQSSGAVPSSMPMNSGHPGPSASTLTRAEEYDLKKHVASLERKIATLGKKVDGLRESMQTVEPSDYQALQDIQTQLTDAIDEKDRLEEEWIEAAEKLA